MPMSSRYCYSVFALNIYELNVCYISGRRGEKWTLLCCAGLPMIALRALYQGVVRQRRCILGDR